MLERPNYQIDLDVRQTWHRMSRMYNQKATAYGLSMSVGFILLHIDKDGTPSTQLGPRMGMEPTSLSRTLKSMEDDKLIRREIDSEDKRKVLIFLTPKGIEKRRIVRDVVLDFDDRLISRIPKTKLKAYFDVMDIIDGFIDKELKIMNE